MNEREMYGRLYAHSQDTVLILDSEKHTILFANPRASEDTSYEAEELLGMPVAQLFLPEDAPAIATLLQSTLQWKAGTDPQRTLRRKSGKKIITEITTQFVPFEAGHAIAFNIRDITARVKAEDALRKLNAELEDRVVQRTEQLRLQKKQLDDVMANIQEGILTLRSDLKVNPEFSGFTREIFGNREIADQPFDRLVFADSQEELQRAASLKAWVQEVFAHPEQWDLLADFGPREVTLLGEVPKILNLAWRPIFESVGSDAGSPPTLTKLMVVVTDVTETKRLQAELQHQEEAHREELELIAQMLHVSRSVVDQFVADLRRHVDVLSALSGQGELGTSPEAARSLHTLKGAARQMGLKRLESLVHELEQQRSNPEACASLFEKLLATWKHVSTLYEQVLHADAGDLGAIDMRRYRLLLLRAFRGREVFSAASVRRALVWLHERPIGTLIERLEQEAQTLAAELNIRLAWHAEHDAFSLPADVMDGWHDALLHLVRNALDHGYDPQKHGAADAPPYLLNLQFRCVDDRVECTFADNGRGIDRDAVARKLVERGLSLPPDADVVEGIFLPGFSTRDQVSELSGRGVGLDVVHHQLVELWGGHRRVESQLGKGTTFVLTAPRSPLPKLTLISPDDPPVADALVVADVDGPALVEALRRHPEALGVWSPRKDPEEAPWIEELIPRLVRARQDAPLDAAGFFLKSPAIRGHRDGLHYAEKSAWIEAMLSDFRSALPGKVHTGIFESIGVIAEELIMNAFFDAPIDVHGQPKYAAWSRTQTLVLEAHERVVFEWAADPHRLVVSAEDPFGRLTRDVFWAHIAKGFKKSQDQINRQGGGAGLGLYFLIENAPLLIVDVRPGALTRVTAVFPVTKSFEAFQRSPRGFLFNTASVTSS